MASPKQWQRIIAEKGSECRLAHPVQRHELPIEYHHLVSRAQGGDDVADNIVPLCSVDHDLVTSRHKLALYRLWESLTDSERAYVAAKLGEASALRAFGVGR